VWRDVAALAKVKQLYSRLEVIGHGRYPVSCCMLAVVSGSRESYDDGSFQCRNSIVEDGVEGVKQNL
jgi:hypothetical protein